jgi:hypothetical protein
VIHVPAPDPFTVFGLSRSLDLDERQLETRPPPRQRHR